MSFAVNRDQTDGPAVARRACSRSSARLAHARSRITRVGMLGFQ
ncbi:MAG TPA: hypothetical protein VH063_04350 [Gaiellaceae bacterium]|nr:hypothetical protein [Gaiellaceae bacterium]